MGEKEMKGPGTVTAVHDLTAYANMIRIDIEFDDGAIGRGHVVDRYDLLPALARA